MNNSDNYDVSKIILAKWKDRFFAWVIDFVIISLISTSVVFLYFLSLSDNFDNFITNNGMYVPTSVIFFLYWIILEYKTGQTIGKKILNIKIISIEGKKPNLKGVLISSFGKAFLLPFDVLFGWILTNENRQRVFNRLGDTVVIKIKNTESSDVKFIKD